ncbi:MAG: DNA-deoxyinosine glycosylase [Erysipelotrichaceae bacterium]|uniref:DNA-deoxyinosine glycosylase n=1 Tax=Floccifex sp. TaxID=2815810 RepID=UPI002A75DEBC|nr:DNA-deoxyinosine glycosylase [Floccifex sp.]MDD7282166.1 DNA-deoxyinosine glycosylase [Erysipelotrichaceae bacterium]MDY2959059.1 DNA-deoxyinosine glycosylase [Floccifex sp.]
MCRIIGFDAIVHKNDKVLILGSMPSVKSLQEQMYYANPNNRFWPMLQAIYHMPIETNEQKKQILEKNHIALWDICHSCIRPGSLDSHIKEIVPNDIVSLLKENPSIERIICNGKTSYKLLKKHFDLDAISCPSTSSANASMRLDDLVKIYKEVLK